MKHKKKSLKRVLIMAGGTGGHVFPGLAVANHLRQQHIDVHWLGTHEGIESRLVPEQDIPLHLVAIKGLRGKGVKPLITAPFKILKAIMQSMRIMHKISPDVVIGMGGFVSGPGGIASSLLRVPLVVHEQNATAGLTNKLLAPFAKQILEGFPRAFRAQRKVVSVGNPVRPEIENGLPPEIRFAYNNLNANAKPLRLLILGGSQGAQALNDLVPKVLLEMSEKPLVLHQTGNKHFEQTKENYRALGMTAEVVPFIEKMDQAYAWADVVLCRAGASTIAELCAVGLGAILVPYPYAVNDHQTANAQFMVEKGAAFCIPQAQLTVDRLVDLLKELMQSPAKRLAMAQAAYGLRKIHVAQNIIEICKEVCR